MAEKLSLAKLLIFIFCVGCTSRKNESVKSDQPIQSPHDSLFTTQIIPMLKIERDTIDLGDSLIATIGVIFSPKITDEQKNEIINSLTYHVDLNSTRDDPADSLFNKNHRINDSTFRISLLPNASNYREGQVIKKDFHAHVKMNYLVVNKNVPEVNLFTDVITYYLNDH